MFTFLLVITFVCTASAHHNHLTNQLANENDGGFRTVDIKEYPYQVSIWDKGGYWCGGSILTTNHVLSTAHCALLGVKPLVVRAGSSFSSSGGSIHEVDFKVVYDNLTDYDVAIFRVKEPFVFDETRQPIEIVVAGQKSVPGTVAVLTTWGDANTEKDSKQLKAVDLPILDEQVCNGVFNGTEYGPLVNGQLCAGYANGGKVICEGDSGNPLVINHQQVGIVSIGSGCTQHNAPGIYAEISYYSEWIKKHIVN